jgi:hypothetical protein
VLARPGLKTHSSKPLEASQKSARQNLPALRESPVTRTGYRDWSFFKRGFGARPPAFLIAIQQLAGLPFFAILAAFWYTSDRLIRHPAS